MEKLTMEHINSIIDSEEYEVTPQYIQCILMVGEAPIIGTSYCFHQKYIDVEAGKASAKRDAIGKLFDAEAYHQKRLRNSGMGRHWSETVSADATIIDLNLGNPFKGMAERDVKLEFGGVDCQAMLKEFAEQPPLTPQQEADAMIRQSKIGYKPVPDSPQTTVPDDLS